VAWDINATPAGRQEAQLRQGEHRPGSTKATWRRPDLLKEDPAEQRTAAEQHPEVVARLRADLHAAHTPSLLWKAPGGAAVSGQRSAVSGQQTDRTGLTADRCILTADR